MQIKNVLTGEVLHDSGNADLSNADLSNADLSNANLRYAALSNADLSNADLLGEKLKSNPVFVYGLTWFITVTNEFLTIGCQRHSHSDWAGFDDARIGSMHSGAIAFWRKWKPSLMLMCAEQSGL